MKNARRPLVRCTFAGVVALLLIGSAWAEDAGNELVQMVLTLLSDKDKDVRAVGLEQVRNEAKGEAATKEFASQLPQLSSEVQTLLLSALADRGDAAARPAVLELLSKSAEEPVRVAAIGALGSLGSVADAPQLVKLLGAESKPVAAAARASLIRLPGEATPAAITTEMKRSESAIRVTLIEVLAARRALESLPDLVAAAVDADASVRSAAMVALGEMAGEEQIPGMVQGVLKAEKGPERDAAERAVSQVCGRATVIAHGTVVLLAAMDKLAPGDRLAVLPTLGRVGGPEALKVIEQAIADKDLTMHEVGLRALCNWPDASIAARLIELASFDDHPAHRTMVLAALIRVAPLPDKRPDSERLELLKKSLSMCQRDDERKQVLKRARAIRTIETLRFLAPYMEQPVFAEIACESVVELAHHRGLREPNKPEFDKALDKVIATNGDATVVDRAKRYKAGQTWVRPKAADAK